MALGVDTSVLNAMLNALRDAVAGNCLIRFYSGARPARGASVAGNTLLAQLTGNATFAPNAANATLTLNAISPTSSAAASGIASFFRIVKADGTTFIMDGSVSTVVAGNGDARLDDTSIVLGGTVALSSGTFTLPTAA
jgi:hypothetical protein